MKIASKFPGRCNKCGGSIAIGDDVDWRREVRGVAHWGGCDEASRAKVAQAAVERQAAVVASRASDAEIDLPCPEGLAYLPYQRAGIAAALARPNVLFGDEMGLGKTIQAIGVINSDPTIKRVLVVCPASLKLNWRNELRKWLVREMSIQVAEAKSCEPNFTDIVIVNYDILAKLSNMLRAAQWDLVVFDEAHYLKNPDAKRTVAALGKDAKKGAEAIAGIDARRKVMLTGTPIPNRPIEGQPIFHYLAPDEYGFKFFPYAKRYADAHQNGYGWDFSGAANLPELQEKLRATIMIRRLKADVLTELPAKRRAVIEFVANGATAIVAKETAAWQRNEDAMVEMRAAVELAKASDDPEVYRAAVERLQQAAQAAFAELAKLRHDTAVAKIPYVIEHLRDLIEQGEKVVFFAHHHDVIEAIASEFGTAAVTVYGNTPMAQRQANVERFQSDGMLSVHPCMLFVGGIQAAGVGLTLTASAHVVFGELDWVPGNVTQAEDRCHRIGQRNCVLVEHLVLAGSLDARMATILIEKQEVIAAALDNEVDTAAPVVPVEKKERAATENTSRAKIEAEAAKMTPERIAAVHQGLRILAGMDGDHAAELNGAGFSKVDVWVGHSLADSSALTARQAALGAKLVNRYRRQLPAELAAIAKGQA